MPTLQRLSTLSAVPALVLACGLWPNLARAEPGPNLIHNGSFESCRLATAETTGSTAAGSPGECVDLLDVGQYRARVDMDGWSVLGHNYLWSLDNGPLGAAVSPRSGEQYTTLYQDTQTAFSHLVQPLRTCVNCSHSDWQSAAPLELEADLVYHVALAVDTSPWQRASATGAVVLESVNPSTGAAQTLRRVDFPDSGEGWQMINFAYVAHEGSPVGEQLQLRIENSGDRAVAVDDVELRVEALGPNIVINGGFEQCPLWNANHPSATTPPCGLESESGKEAVATLPAFDFAGFNYRVALHNAQLGAPRDAIEGNQCIQIHHNTELGHTELSQGLHHGPNADALLINEGQHYELRAEIMTEIGGYAVADARLGFVASDPLTGQRTWLAAIEVPASGGSWQTIVLSMPSPEVDSPYIGQELQLVIDVEGDRPVAIDDLRVHQVALAGL